MEAYHKETLGKAMAHAFPYHRYMQEEINAYTLVNIVGLCIFIHQAFWCVDIKIKNILSFDKKIEHFTRRLTIIIM